MNRIASKLILLVLVPSLWASTVNASSLSDFQCLTSDMKGNDQARSQFITAAREASHRFTVAPSILVAIKRTESGLGLDPMVINRNNNGSVDRGYFQINTRVWLPEIQRLGVEFSQEDIHSVRSNALIAAWVLRRQLDRFNGDAYQAVGHYHKGGGIDASSHRIRKVYLDKFMGHLRSLVRRCGQEQIAASTTKRKDSNQL